MNLLFEIRILDSNLQYYDSNDQAVILTLESQYQRSAQHISYDNFWVKIFIMRDRESWT